MPKKLLPVIFIFLTSLSFGQYLTDYGFSVGASNYLGDIGGGEGTRRDFVMDMKFNATRWNIGGFYRYRISPKFGIKGTLNYIRLAGDDANTTYPYRRGRNLNFKNDMFELAAIGELYIYKVNDVGGTGRYTSDFNLYLFGGAGLFYSNPKGQAANGDWIALQPLQTEGVAYSKFNFTIPAGVGFYYTINRKYRLGMEISWRTTFMDYIDDVSSLYIAHTDPTAAAMANKTNQAVIDQIAIDNPDADKLPKVTTYQPGRKRGDDSHDDSYLTATVNFSWAIRSRSKYYRSRHGWVLGKKGPKRRKSRAKF